MLPQRPRDLCCMRGETGAVDAPRPRQIDTELLANTPRMRREQNHPIAETDRFTNVVRYEHYRFLASCPDFLQIPVEVLTCHGIERCKRLVHQQYARIRRERPGQ